MIYLLDAERGTFCYHVYLYGDIIMMFGNNLLWIENLEYTTIGFKSDISKPSQSITKIDKNVLVYEKGEQLKNKITELVGTILKSLLKEL